MTAPAARPIATSLADLVPPGARREPLPGTDGKSGAVLERVEVDGRPMVLKRLDVRRDWTMRAVGDVACGTAEMWRRGLFDRLPDCFTQPIVGIAVDADPHPAGYGCWLLMDDVGEHLIPSGDDAIDLAVHEAFIDHMAAFHAAFWDGGPEIDIVPPANRLLELSPWTAVAEEATDDDHLVPRLIGQGWAQLPEVAPGLAAVVDLATDPSPLVDALATTPSTFVHGNWKLGNLGRDHTGRTVLFDWENPGRGWGCAELAWYLAINAARLPCSREDTIEHYRRGLEARGIATDDWWDRQVALGMVAGLVWFGWEKALGGDTEELAWWGIWLDRAGLVG